jgi:peptide/nickel transport system substrate-binding protein
MLVAKHVWEHVEPDPLTFKNYDPEKGWPLMLGPYVLNKVTQNEVDHGSATMTGGPRRSGLKSLPAPKRVIYSYAGTEEVRVATGIDDGFDGLQDITLSSFEALEAAATPTGRLSRMNCPTSGPIPAPAPSHSTAWWSRGMTRICAGS